MSVFAVVLLAAAVVLLGVAEWPRLAMLLGIGRLRARRHMRRRSRLSVVRGSAMGNEPDEADEFARSVQRDLESLPTIDERDRGKR